MKFTLKDYQEEAVRNVLSNLRKARKRWHEDGDKHAFSLTAPTAAGKTVMAAAAFEALFHGDDHYDFDKDPSAVVIWFSDDPNLNEQSRFRLMESSDRLQHSDLVVVENTFNRPQFDAGKIYFLNTQKLGKKSLLVRGFDGDEEGQFPEMRPDMRAYTIWDTIRNTVEDSTKTLYLVLDEAHRGMGDTSAATLNEKSTIVKRLINGDQGVPGIPVVLGISATVERFTKAMEGAKGRTTLSAVEVDRTRVQDSGLLKDTIILDIPKEAGTFDTVLVRRATDKLRDSTEAWAAYAKQQENGEAVLPLLVLQVPNTPNLDDIGRALDTIFEQWPELPASSVAHVFGEHTEQTFGRHNVPHISPERVQDATWVRILIAKDAISTGWDCPRAEVMVSFRRAVDRTHITQLLGRMVRTPLARRIPGNDQLNSVDCLLPFFDEATVKEVVNALMQGSGDTPPIQRVLINPKPMTPNPAVTETVWDKFVSLPSQTRPQRNARPPIRLTALAHELVIDGLLPEAGKLAHVAMHKALDDFISQHADEFTAKRKSVLTVEGTTVIADLHKNKTADGSFQAEADAVVINDAYRRTGRILSPDITRTYTEVLAGRKPQAKEDYEDAIIEAREDISALGLMDNVGLHFDAEATTLSSNWLKKYRDAIKKLPDDRQDSYRQIGAMSREPQDVDLAQPLSRMEATMVRETDGTETKLPFYPHHLLCDEQGTYPAVLSDSERTVLLTEMKRKGFKFWYRNPDRPSQDSLGIAYEYGDDTNISRPDFLFFAEAADGTIAVDIIDPHGVHLDDALPKLKGLARYAVAHPKVFRRIEGVTEVKEKLRTLNLNDPSVREAIFAAKNARSLFEGPLASDYV